MKKTNAAVLPKPVELEETLTTVELARLLKMKPSVLSNWRTNGIGPAYLKISAGQSGHVRYPKSAIQAWMDARMVETREVA